MAAKQFVSTRGLVVTLVAMFIIASGLVIRHLTVVSKQLAETAARENAARYSEALAMVRSRYTSEVVERVRSHGIEVTHDYLQKEAAIPLPATLTIDLGKHIGETGSGAKVELYSDYPFLGRESRKMDAFQKYAIEQLRQAPGQPVEQMDWDNGLLRYATADLMRESCVECHNSHPQSVKTDWKVNDVRGVLEVTLPIDQVAAETQAATRGTVTLMLILGAIGVVGLGLVISRIHQGTVELERRANETTEALRKQQTSNEQLDLRSAELARVNQELENRQSSLAEANRQLEQRTAALTDTQQAIGQAARGLGDAAKDIMATTSDQAAGARQQAAAVAQMVASVDELSQSANQTSARSGDMAQAARKTTEVGEAGRGVIQDAMAAMQRVKKQVESIADNILSLSEQAQAIGRITETVADIAEQTNVLALNAAVEASRAGEHGKGFAVVASEVKELADQSKTATAEVSAILTQIRAATNTAVLSIEEGTRSVDEAGNVVSQAGETIKALGGTLAESSKSVHQIRASAGQQAAAVGQLHSGVKDIDRVTRENLESINQIEQAAQNLTILCDQLTALTGQ